MEHKFSKKFHLLNSQQSSQEIIWSSSDTSDSENESKQVGFQRTVNTGSTKRKRSQMNINKRKNVSYLDITFSDSVKEKISPKSNEVPESTNKGSISPILNFSQHKCTNANLSPILSARSLKNTEKLEKRSPILQFHNIKPKYSVKVKKKLFNSDARLDLTKEINTIINSTKKEVPLTKRYNIENQDKSSSNKNVQIIKKYSDTYSYDNQKIFENITNIPDSKINNSNADKRIKLDNTNITNDTWSLKKELCEQDTLRTTNLDSILNKVETYFNNNFDTEVSSQHSISEYESTPQNSSKTSEEIDSISSTQQQSYSTKVLEDSSKYLEITDKSKKIKYKKDGLAYRLNSVLKKENANVSLWQHERFLALNSNFIIPAGEYTAFRIKSIQFKYGVYLLEGKDVNNEIYYILINSASVSERQIKQDIILKLYKPFKIMTLENNSKLILNATKFECKEIM